MRKARVFLAPARFDQAHVSTAIDSQLQILRPKHHWFGKIKKISNRCYNRLFKFRRDGQCTQTQQARRTCYAHWEPMPDQVMKLQLLGQVSVCVADRPIVLRTRKSLGLLAHLALESSTSRSELAELFWGDMTEEDARMNLRRELGRIKQAGFEHVTTRGSSLALPETLECDVLAFQQAVRNERWLEALNLYRGAFLDGLKSEGQSMFNDWLERTRARLQDQYLEVLQGRATELEHEHKLPEALALCLKSLELDDLSEHRYRFVIRLQGLLGQRETAIKSNQRLTEMLEREFGLQPLPESAQLMDRIRAVPSHVRINSSPAPNPIQTMPLVGREQVWAQLESIWEKGKFIFLAGEAGTGKTRLILEFMDSKGPFGFLDGRPTDRDQPYSTVVRSMREIFVRRPDVQLEPWMRQALSHLLPELGVGKHIEVIQSEEELLRLYEAIGLLSYSVSNNAAAICSDDFHFWDDATLRATAYGAMKAMNAGQSSKVFTNYRKSELSPFTRGILDNYLQMGFAEEIELKPLTELQTWTWCVNFPAAAPNVSPNAFTMSQAATRSTRSRSCAICSTSAYSRFGMGNGTPPLMRTLPITAN